MTRQPFTSPGHEPWEDAYPSRNGGEPAFLNRLDPVIYAGDWQDSPMDSSDLAHYEEHGFVVLHDVFDRDEVRLLQEEIETLRSSSDASENDYRVREPGGRTLRSIFAVHRSNALFARLAADSRLVRPAEFILSDNLYIHQSRLNYKPGFRGKEFYWHSDFETWHVEDGMPRMRALSVSIALTENSPENGPLMLIPGSHRKYVACAGQTPENHFLASLRKQEYGVPGDDLLRQLADEGGIVAVDAQPGSVVIFDCNTMHGSNGNITPYPRSNAFLVYNALGNRVGRPFCDREPRPEHICTREHVTPVTAIQGRIRGA